MTTPYIPLDYAAYLRSPAWASLRRQILLRAGFVCEGCGAKPAEEVHHLNYDHIGGEFLWELVAVCQECHHRLHPEHGE